MLQLSKTLLNQPILSLRTGGEIAHSLSLIINPNNLKIEGLLCSDRFDKRQLVLLPQDIREIATGQGIIVNDHDVLTDPSELIRLQPIMELEFELIGKPVETVSKKKLGKVGDFAVESQGMFIHKLYVEPPLVKSLTKSQLSVDRTQIIEITNRRIIVKDIDATVKIGVPAAAPAV